MCAIMMLRWSSGRGGAGAPRQCARQGSDYEDRKFGDKDTCLHRHHHTRRAGAGGAVCPGILRIRSIDAVRPGSDLDRV